MTERPLWKNFDDFLSDTNNELPAIESEQFVSRSMDDLWPEWQTEARCYDQGTDYFFGDEEQQPTMSIKQIRQASKLCDVCPVFRECLSWALTNNEEYGVWAGTSGRTRRRIQHLLTEGVVTVAEVVEDFYCGRGSQYTGGAPGTRGGSGGSVSPLPRRERLQDEDRRVHAQ